MNFFGFSSINVDAVSKYNHICPSLYQMVQVPLQYDMSSNTVKSVNEKSLSQNPMTSNVWKIRFWKFSGLNSSMVKNIWKQQSNLRKFGNDRSKNCLPDVSNFQDLCIEILKWDIWSKIYLSTFINNVNKYKIYIQSGCVLNERNQEIMKYL